MSRKTITGTFFCKFYPVYLEILVTRAYSNNSLNIERKLPSVCRKALTRRRKRDKRKCICKAFCVTGNDKMYLRMPSENFEQIFQLVKDDITRENTKMRESIPPRLTFAAIISLFINRESLQESSVFILLYTVFVLLRYHIPQTLMFFPLRNDLFNIYIFCRFHLFHLFFSNHLYDFFTFSQ